MNRALIAKTHNISRMSLFRWEQEGTHLGKLAKLGVAIDPEYVREISEAVRSSRFDDLSKMPPRNLAPVEIEWLRIAYSFPDGPILDPRPRAGAPKGVYYDETKKVWRPRPFVNLPSAP